MRACLALSILSDTRTAASTDSARSLKSTLETGHSALSGSAVAEPIVTPPPTSTRNAAAAATGTRWRARAERVGLAAGMPARTAATAVSRSMSSGIGSAMTSARQEDSSATTWSSAWYARPPLGTPKPADRALISSSSAWTATRSTGSSSGVPWKKDPLP